MTKAAEKKAPPKAVTAQMYQDLLGEVENVTEQLTKTREQLWKTQDELRESEDKSQQLEMHISELVSTHEKDAERIQNLMMENSTHIEEEAKVRESLDLMKKVFTRSQLKSKEDQETIMLLQEERDLLLEENDVLGDQNSMSKHERAAINRIQREGADKERQLSRILEKTKKDLENAKARQAVSDENIKTLTKRLVSNKNPADAERQQERQLEKQRKRIDELERQLVELQESDDQLLQRAILDDDLEDSVTRQLMGNLDCASFNRDLKEGAYTLLGYKE
jgi:chromosome segregation ATPase